MTRLQNKIIDRISDVSMVMLLPLFFVYTGLRTQVGILNTPSMWFSFSLILICAITGKLGGSTLIPIPLGKLGKTVFPLAH